MDKIRLFFDQNTATFYVMAIVFVLIVFLCFVNNRRDIKSDPIRMIVMAVVFFIASLCFIVFAPQPLVRYDGLSDLGVVIAVGFSVVYLFVCLMMNDREFIRVVSYIRG